MNRDRSTVNPHLGGGCVCDNMGTWGGGGKVSKCLLLWAGLGPPQAAEAGGGRGLLLLLLISSLHLLSVLGCPSVHLVRKKGGFELSGGVSVHYENITMGYLLC